MRSVLLANGCFRAVCRGDQMGFTLDEASQGSLGVAFVTGSGVRQCTEFGGTVIRDTPATSNLNGFFKARDAAAPATCPLPQLVSTGSSRTRQASVGAKPERPRALGDAFEREPETIADVSPRISDRASHLNERTPDRHGSPTVSDEPPEDTEGDQILDLRSAI